DVPPVYVAATAPKMQALAGEIGDGCLTPSITTPAFVRYTRENVNADIDIGCTIVASIHANDRASGRDGAREIARQSLANEGEDREETRRVGEGRAGGGGRGARARVRGAPLERSRPIAGRRADCIAAIQEYKDAGCPHVMLELWGANRHEQIRLFGEQVLPHV